MRKQEHGALLDLRRELGEFRVSTVWEGGTEEEKKKQRGRSTRSFSYLLHFPSGMFWG